MVQVRWDSLMIYKQYCGAKGQTTEKLDKYRKEAYGGKVKDASRKRMIHAIDMMIQLSRVQMKPRPGGKVFPFRLGFWTLTVPGKVRKATDVHPLFKKFLDWMRYRNCQYIWKAEYQKRGQVHYHLIVNQYIPYVEVKAGWNSILRKARYLDGYAKQTGHFSPNSVDLRAVKSNKFLSLYLQKYLTKKEENLPKGHLKKWWGASQSLMGKRFVTEMWGGDWDAIRNSKKIIEDVDCKWMMVFGKRKDILSEYSQNQYNRWRVERRKAGWTLPKKKVRIKRAVIGHGVAMATKSTKPKTLFSK